MSYCLRGVRHKGDENVTHEAHTRNAGTCRPDAKGELQVRHEPISRRVPMQGTGADSLVGAMKSGNADGAKGGDRAASAGEATVERREELSCGAKSFAIPKRLVWDAWKAVKANKGAAGSDGQTIEEYEKDLKNNLYRLWNRMSSGSYMPKSIRQVFIPKGDGGLRELGIASIEDRVAQTVAKLYLEPLIEPYLHKDMYGYRPGRSAHDAIEVTRKRCWKYNWVVDVDIKGFFPSIDRALLDKAVRKHTNCSWLLLYLPRWLAMPVHQVDGTFKTSDKGVAQGSPLSPVLANLYMHYAVVAWFGREFPLTEFAVYADDMVIHARSKEEAERIRGALDQRLKTCGLMLHPEKTKVVYCKDANRPVETEHIAFDFLGHTFRPREAMSKYGKVFTSFLPGISRKALKQMHERVRKLKLTTHTHLSLEGVAELLNPLLRGWIQYFGRFYREALHNFLSHIDTLIAKWLRRKHKPLRRRKIHSTNQLRRIAERQPRLFAHWTFGATPATAR